MRRLKQQQGDNQNWRRGSACIKWCPVQVSDSCSAAEPPSDYEPPVATTTEGDSQKGEDGTNVDNANEGISESVVEYIGIQAATEVEYNTEQPPEEDQLPETDGDEVNQADPETETENPETTTDEKVIVDVPADQKVSFQSRRVIKVPCIGKNRPDRQGNCRAVY